MSYKIEVESFSGENSIEQYSDWMDSKGSNFDIISINTLHNNSIFITYRREKGFWEF